MKVSRNQFRIALLTTITIMGLGCGPMPTKDLAESAQFVMITLGDSYASGEGNPDTFVGGRANWNLNTSHDARLCHRSRKNGHYLAAADFSDLWQLSSDVKYASFACGGASIERGLLNPQFSGPLCGSSGNSNIKNCTKGQVDQAVDWIENTQNGVLGVDVVTISIGGNDLGFAGAIAYCLHPAKGNCNNSPELASMVLAGCTSRSSPIENCPRNAIGLSRMRLKLNELIEQVREKIRPKKIILVGYPDPTRDANGNFCKAWTDGFKVANENLFDSSSRPVQVNLGVITPFALGATIENVGLDEWRWAYSHLLRPLNQELEQSAEANGIEFVGGLDVTSRNHGLCSGEPVEGHPIGRWFLTLQDSQNSQNDLNGALHPNAQGHEAYREAILGRLQTLFLTNNE